MGAHSASALTRLSEFLNNGDDKGRYAPLIFYPKAATLLKHLEETLPSILRQYHKAHSLTDVPILVDHLRPMFQERGFADRFIWEAYDFPAKNIAAQISFYSGHLGVYAGKGDYARIQYSRHLNFCWQRFALCKEMYHSILDDDPAKRVTAIEDLQKLSEMLVSGATSHLEPFRPHETEQEAEILALETLFPLELRLAHKEQYDEGMITDHQLALRYRIPEEFARIGMYPHYLLRMVEFREGTLIAIV